MLDATFELISMAASNSHMVFCFCNLIIAILLVGISKPNSQFNEEKPKVGPSPTIVKDEILMKETVSLVEADQELSSVSMTMIENDQDVMSPDEEDDDDDDLKRRAEEFIEKINREWRAEKLKSYSLGK